VPNVEPPVLNFDSIDWRRTQIQMFQIKAVLGWAGAEPTIVKARHKAGAREDPGVNAHASLCIELDPASESDLILLLIGGNDAEPVLGEHVLDSYRCCFQLEPAGQPPAGLHRMREQPCVSWLQIDDATSSTCRGGIPGV